MNSTPKRQPVPATKKKVRHRNPGKTREKLLQATIDLLAEKGPDALSLKEAASLAKVSRGVAYQHFADRDHLLAEAKAWMSDRLLDSAKAIQPALRQDNVLQVMDEQVHNVARLVLNNREAARLLIVDALAGKALDSTHPIYNMVIADLEALQASGVGRSDADIEILSFILLGAVSTIIMLSHLPDAGGTDSLAERFSAEWTRLLREGMFDGIESQNPPKPTLKQTSRSRRSNATNKLNASPRTKR